MSVKSLFAIQFERQFSEFSNDLHLNPLQCRLFSKKVDELANQSLSPRNKRDQFAKWVESCVQQDGSKDMNSTLPELTSLEFDRKGTQYRAMRIYDEVFGLRSSLVACIDSYHDAEKISSEKALQLIAFIKNASTIKGPSSLLYPS